ncbi:right-handed parallel beta-helix repeat-containing protein [Candidatus Eisenbacteria bacterium]|uniref:Right-handed parallel beta-helix repeat-containing protein n=1 Tax=Eiseniibacteriota bacterium TaxID=2212470 RepID=A0ABV6YMP9_UNCEI
MLVGCGVYYEYNVYMKSGVVLRSATGEPDCATIDAEQQSRCLVCFECDNTTVIEGITVTGGRAIGGIYYGGGARCEVTAAVFRRCIFTGNVADVGGGVACLGASPRFEDCVFFENYAGTGGGVGCTYSSPEFARCLFSGNWAEYYGGGLWCEVECSPLLSRCTLVENGAVNGGGGIGCQYECSPMLRNTIITFSGYGEAIWREYDNCNPLLFCCNLYGNAGGDWTDFIVDQWGKNGNFASDPSFCDMANGDLTVAENSPCLPGNHPSGYTCGDVIGCHGQGCAVPEIIKLTTWSSIKAIYR